MTGVQTCALPIFVWRKSFAWFAEGTVQFVPDAAGVFQELRLDVPNDDLWFDELKFRRKP